MFAFADSDRPGGVRPAVLGRRAQFLSIDVGGAQFQRRTGHRCCPQDVSTVALGLGLQAAATEYACKAFTDTERAFQPGGTETVGLPRIERNGRACRAGKTTEHFSQAAAGDIEGLNRTLLLRRHRRGVRCSRP
ncbi:hypothetical protein D9M71_503260 [compost metagenome]